MTSFAHIFEYLELLFAKINNRFCAMKSVDPIFECIAIFSVLVVLELLSVVLDKPVVTSILLKMVIKFLVI